MNSSARSPLQLVPPTSRNTPEHTFESEHPSQQGGDALLDAIAESIADRVVERLPTITPTSLPEATKGKLALTKAEAADALGCSVDHLERHVMPDLRIVRSGRLRLIPIRELERWIERNAARALGAAA